MQSNDAAKESVARYHALIVEELRTSLSLVQDEQVARLLDEIQAARTTLVVGAGRMGILLSTFSMRLNHLGLPSHLVGSTSCPPIGETDLLLAASSSGETPTVREVVRKAREHRARIAIITAVPDSPIAAMGSLVVYVQAPASLDAPAQGVLRSLQPMKTLFEQTLFITLEAMVLALMGRTGRTAADMARRHGNLE